GARAGAVPGHRHQQPLRGHSVGPGRGPRGRTRPRREREPAPGARRAVRARARLGAAAHGQRGREPDGGRAHGRADVRAARSPGGGPGSRARGATDDCGGSPDAGPGRQVHDGGGGRGDLSRAVGSWLEGDSRPRQVRRAPYRPSARPPIFPSSHAELPMKTQGANQDVVFLSGVRTGFGAFGGSLKDLSATELGAVAARTALERSGVPAGEIGHTVFGNALQTSADAIYLARHVGLNAGLPIEVPAVTVNRLCGSGFEAIAQAAQLILLGEASAVLAGGAESMSQAPHVVRGARWGLRLGPAAPLEDLLWEALKDPQCGLSMAETAENLAERYQLTRQEVDEVALASQQRAKQAWDACVFQDEVVGVPIKQKGQTVEY